VGILPRDKQHIEDDCIKSSPYSNIRSRGAKKKDLCTIGIPSTSTPIQVKDHPMPTGLA
jgi:hypothetical protein